MAQGNGLRLAGIERPIQGHQHQAEEYLADEAAQHRTPVLGFHSPAHPEYGQVCFQCSVPLRS